MTNHKKKHKTKNVANERKLSQWEFQPEHEPSRIQACVSTTKLPIVLCHIILAFIPYEINSWIDAADVIQARKFVLGHPKAFFRSLKLGRRVTFQEDKKSFAEAIVVVLEHDEKCSNNVAWRKLGTRLIESSMRKKAIEKRELIFQMKKRCLEERPAYMKKYMSNFFETSTKNGNIVCQSSFCSVMKRPQMIHFKVIEQVGEDGIKIENCQTGEFSVTVIECRIQENYRTGMYNSEAFSNLQHVRLPCALVNYDEKRKFPIIEYYPHMDIWVKRFFSQNFYMVPKGTSTTEGPHRWKVDAPDEYWRE